MAGVYFFFVLEKYRGRFAKLLKGSSIGLVSFWERQEISSVTLGALASMVTISE